MNKFDDVRKRVFTFALNIIRLCSILPRNSGNNVIINQILRSATSIGANLEETAGAHTRVDFIYTMNIAKKEARESNYWLKLLFESNDQQIKDKIKALIGEGTEIAKILTASVKNARKAEN